MSHIQDMMLTVMIISVQVSARLPAGVSSCLIILIMIRNLDHMFTCHRIPVFIRVHQDCESRIWRLLAQNMSKILQTLEQNQDTDMHVNPFHTSVMEMIRKQMKFVFCCGRWTGFTIHHVWKSEWSFRPDENVILNEIHWTPLLSSS